jgi:hypothetical protein
MFRLPFVVSLCVLLTGCLATTQQVATQLGDQYIGKNVDTLVVSWGPPKSTFRMNSGGMSYQWELSSLTGFNVDRNGSGSASTLYCKVTVVTTPTGIITQLDTEDHQAVIPVAGSMCAQRLRIQQQT